MSSVRIEFDTDNAAFDDSISPGSFWYETTQVLEQVVKGLDSGADTGRLRDSNGNVVGYWKYIDSERFDNEHA